MPKLSIRDLEVEDREVLMRVDFNVPLSGGEITDARRIEAALPTIKSVIDRGGRAVLMSHLGRPEGTGYESKYSLEVAAKKLGDLLGKPVNFPSQDCTDEAAASAVNAMSDGDVLLLENLGHDEAADGVERAVASAIRNRAVTPDLGGTLGTAAVGDRIAEAVARAEVVAS